MLQDVGIVDQQKAYKQGRDDSIKQFSTQLHPTYLWCGKICGGGVVYWTVLCYHPYLVCMLFADLLSLHLITFL